MIKKNNQSIRNIKDTRKIDYGKLLDNHPKLAHHIRLHSGRFTKRHLSYLSHMSRSINPNISKQYQQRANIIQPNLIYSDKVNNINALHIKPVSFNKVKHHIKDGIKELNRDEISKASREISESKIKNHSVNMNEINNFTSHNNGLRTLLRHKRVPKNFYQSSYHKEKKMLSRSENGARNIKRNGTRKYIGGFTHAPMKHLRVEQILHSHKIQQPKAIHRNSQTRQQTQSRQKQDPTYH